jgi:hypothetical protein
MAEGIVSLRKTQFGREGTAGTAVAATSVQRLMTNGAKDDSVVEFVNEHIGYLAPVIRTTLPKKAASIAFDDSPMTFEQCFYPFDAGIKTVAAVADGAGTGKIYTYTFPTTAVNTVKTYTIESGDNIQAREMEYSFCESIAITFKAGEVVNISSNWIGRQWTNTTFTGALSAPTVEELLTSKGKLYIDAVSGTIGTTQVANTLLSGTLNIVTGWKAVWTADGNLYFSFAKNTQPEVALDLTYEHNSSAETEYAAFVAGTPRLLQLKFEGSALTSAGTTYTYKTVKINLAGSYETWGAFGDLDGNNTVSCSLRAGYNSTAALFAEIIVVNQSATVT